MATLDANPVWLPSICSQPFLRGHLHPSSTTRSSCCPSHANGTTIDPGDYTTITQESTSPPYLYTTANFENMFSAALNIRSKLFSVVPKALCNLVPAHFSPFQLYWTNLVFCFSSPRLSHAVVSALQQSHPTCPFLSQLTPNNSWLRHHFSQEAYPETPPCPGHLIFRVLCNS